MERVLVKLNRVFYDTTNTSSPAVFIHGFPDSPDIFKPYFCTEERQQLWLKNRDIYTISFTNHHDFNKSLSQSKTQSISTKISPKPEYSQGKGRSSSETETEYELERLNSLPPTLFELLSGLVQKHFNAAMWEIIDASPTGKIMIIAHDWGATYSWNFIKSVTNDQDCERPTPGTVQVQIGAVDLVELFVSLSVGSSFRYDIFEHGILAAMSWGYSALFSLPYYFPRVPFVKKILSVTMQMFSGYQLESKDDEPNELDCWHYWYGPLALLWLPLSMLGAGREEEFLAFQFPVLFIRSPIDKMASTSAFEKLIHARNNSMMFIADFKSKHWFVKHESNFVLDKIRFFYEHLRQVGYYGHPSYSHSGSQDSNDNNFFNDIDEFVHINNSN